MIQFKMVYGDVFVQDIDRSYNQMAWSGMALDDNGNYLTALAIGNTVELKSSSFLRIRGNWTWCDRHPLLPASAIRNKEFGWFRLLSFTWQ